MTEEELRALYDEGKKIIRDERAKRVWVFRNKPDQQKAKVAEMDRLMAILVALKDECKLHMEPVYKQPTLLDVPKPVVYN